MHNLEQIIKQIEDIDFKLKKIIFEIKQSRDLGISDELLRLDYQNLINERHSLSETLFFSKAPEKFNDIIDLRCTAHEDGRDYYSIYLHNTKISIGDICYRGYHQEELGGDIGYMIDREYRGNGYAYQALTLLSEKLYEDGIPDFWIWIADESNIASIKTVEKYGGQLIKKYSNGNLLFQCETKKRLDFESDRVQKR